ncbi:hypothetical protein V2J09_009506 [Rumex salicifolius]
MASSLLSSTQRYAAGALFGLALHQAHIHQTRPLGLHYNLDEDGDETIADRISSSSGGSGSSDSVSEQHGLWVNQHSGLLRPVFKALEIDSEAWNGLEETAGNTPAKDHVGAFIRLLCIEGENSSQESEQERLEQEVALTKAIDAMTASMMETHNFESKLEKQQEYNNERREKYVIPDTSATSTEKNIIETLEDEKNCAASNEDASHGSDKEPFEVGQLLSYERRLVVLYELLLACLTNAPEDAKSSKQRSGYDARHRVALRLLATWLDIKFVKLEATETIIACSAMALLKQEELKNDNNDKSEESSWNKWKRGGIIGAAALTGGTLLAITGGLAAPAIAAGFSAMAPTLGTIIPAIGASGFAAAATAAGSVAGSVAIAASFGAAGAGLTGFKTARRTGSVDEFDFKDIGENHKQGRLAVGIFISGFVFDEKDFIMPWEGLDDNLERYALQWESKNLIAVSTAIHDWLTSRLAMELMKQGAMMTVLSTLLTALAWPAALLSATDFIDSKWSIAIDRSDKAGKLLAEALMKGLQGNRPVTLVGYSLGARVIFKCLQFLAEAELNANLVERVVVSGRFINVYSSNDWILGVAFRASLLTKGLAGIQPVNVPGIENVDVTKIIEGHTSYVWATHQILKELELESYFPVFRSTPVRSEHPA